LESDIREAETEDGVNAEGHKEVLDHWQAVRADFEAIRDERERNVLIQKLRPMDPVEAYLYTHFVADPVVNHVPVPETKPSSGDAPGRVSYQVPDEATGAMDPKKWTYDPRSETYRLIGSRNIQTSIHNGD
jgi:hypothetical protein